MFQNILTWWDFHFFFLINFFNAIYLVVFRNVRRIPWAFMSCSVKSSTTFHTRTACMSGSTSLPHVGHTSHVKHRDCRCLILLNIISKAFNRWGQFKPVKKVIKCISCTKLCLPFKFSKEKKSIFSNIYRIFCRLINMTEVKSTI